MMVAVAPVGVIVAFCVTGKGGAIKKDVLWYRKYAEELTTS
jgi:hypothetical protein